MFSAAWRAWAWVRVWPLSAPCATRGAGTPELGRGNPASGAFLLLVHLSAVNRELSSRGAQSGGRTGAQREVCCFPPPASPLTSRAHLAFSRSQCLLRRSAPALPAKRVLGAGSRELRSQLGAQRQRRKGQPGSERAGARPTAYGESGTPRSPSQGLDLAAAAPATRTPPCCLRCSANSPEPTAEGRQARPCSDRPGHGVGESWARWAVSGKPWPGAGGGDGGQARVG